MSPRPTIGVSHQQGVVSGIRADQQRAVAEAERARFAKDLAARRVALDALVPRAPKPVAPPAPPENPPTPASSRMDGSGPASEAKPPASAGTPALQQRPEVPEGSVVLSRGEWRAVQNLMAANTQLAIEEAKRSQK